MSFLTPATCIVSKGLSMAWRVRSEYSCGVQSKLATEVVNLSSPFMTKVTTRTALSLHRKSPFDAIFPAFYAGKN